MKIIEKLKLKQQDHFQSRTPVLCFFGDSVTQGCFETPYLVKDHCDPEAVYHNVLKKMLYRSFPDTIFNVINAGIAGDCAVNCFSRLERDVLSYQPDFCVVCFGLNDANRGPEGIKPFGEALSRIFTALTQAGIESVYLTPNMMNTYVPKFITDPALISTAQATMQYQNSGLFTKYIEEGKAAARRCCVPICDCYQEWKKRHDQGIDTTALLANGINHPCREMHQLFASMLFQTMLDY